MNQFKIPRRLHGRSQQAQWLNELRDALAANMQIPSPHGRLFQRPDGTYQYGPAGVVAAGGVEVSVQHFSIVTHDANTIICYKFIDDPDNPGAQIIDSSAQFVVAKPTLLRGVSPRSTPFSSGAISGTYQEVVTPGYDLLQDIWAVHNPEGGTGLTGIDYLELSPSRLWLPPPTAVCAKVNGQEVTFIVVGGLLTTNP